MIEAINRHFKRGMHLSSNEHGHLVVTEPDTGKFFSLTGMTKAEVDYLDNLKRHRIEIEQEHNLQKNERSIGVRKRFVH